MSDYQLGEKFFEGIANEYLAILRRDLAVHRIRLAFNVHITSCNICPNEGRDHKALCSEGRRLFTEWAKVNNLDQAVIRTLERV